MSQKPWFEFQEKIKDIFVNLGCDSKTNVTIKGVRTEHDVDVLVKSKFLGQDLTWIVEAKKWNKKITKLHVLALRQIVDDTGVDKGFIISENGFQKGAIAASTNTNVDLLTFDEFARMSEETYHRDILLTYKRRLNLILHKYYSHSKKIRIKYGLRHETHFFTGEFDVFFIISTASRGLNYALRNEYPIPVDTSLREKFGNETATNFYQFVNWLNINLIVVDEKILEAEVEMKANNEFDPALEYIKFDKEFHNNYDFIIR